MDNFTAIYKILQALEKAMDLTEFDIEQIGPDALGVSKERWSRYLEMMLDIDLIKGVQIRVNILGECEVIDDDIRITLKGLEYLQENSFMKKVYKTVKGIKEVTPGL